MTAPTLYRHRIYCLTEDAWAYLWKEDDTLLTTCPNDPAHAVQPGSASLIDQVATGIVQIDKEPGFATSGRVRADGLALSAAPLGSATVTKSWPIDIALYSIRVAVTTACVGCTLTVEAGPLTTVGVLAAPAPIGTTVLSVSPTAAANTTPGLVVTLQQGATVQEVGRATAVDTVANQITVETATAFDFAAGTTLVKVTARAAEGLELGIEGMMQFGGERATAVAFPRGRVLSATLANPSMSTARLLLYVSYNY